MPDSKLSFGHFRESFALLLLLDLLSDEFRKSIGSIASSVEVIHRMRKQAST